MCESIIISSLVHIYNQISRNISIAYQLYGTISVVTFTIANDINSSCLGNHARKHFLPLILQTTENKLMSTLIQLEIDHKMFVCFWKELG